MNYALLCAGLTHKIPLKYIEVCDCGIAAYKIFLQDTV